ncbi:uncharacterized protein [Scyliorhinus torazame]
MSIEVVDFGSFGLGNPEPSAIEMDRLSAEILRAFSDIGFVYLKNTGIEDQKVTEVMDICKKFFALPSDIKQQYACQVIDSENMEHGWVAAERERLNPARPGDLKEAFNVSTLSSLVKWPTVNHKPEFRECVESFFKTCELLTVRILKVIALGLGLEGDYFIDKHKYMSSNKNQTTLRSLYYPSIHKSSVKSQQIRCGEHSDYGTFTLLFQDECGGLEVGHKSGQFVAAPHSPNAVLLNIGDLLQRWTSDRLISTGATLTFPCIWGMVPQTAGLWKVLGILCSEFALKKIESLERMNIEVVDFGSFGLEKPEPSAIEMDRLSAEILRAFSDIGFVYLKNTGIEDQKVTEVMDICKKFFALPSDIKQQYARSVVDTENIDHGWVAAERESLNPARPGDLKEAFNVSTLSSLVKWPTINHKPEFRECVESFFKTCELLTVRILKVIALGLGLEGDFFIDKHKKIDSNQNQTTLRSLYYPSIHKPSVKGQQIRCGEHSDYGTVTLLFQDERGGLEVMHKSGQFVAAPHIPNAVLLNIGDLLQRWTSDRLISTVHRVLLPQSDDKMCQSRQSLAFFVLPDNDAIVTCCDGSEKYPPTNPLQYLKERFDATYNM